MAKPIDLSRWDTQSREPHLERNGSQERRQPQEGLEKDLENQQLVDQPMSRFFGWIHRSHFYV